MGTESLTDRFIRHAARIIEAVDYKDVSKHGSRVANAYRLARKELRKLNKL